MPDYQKGKIYKIVSLSTGLTYYGCTTQPLSKRFHQHKREYERGVNPTSAVDVLACCDAKIYLVELYPCNTVEELRAREGYYQQNFECVNMCIAGRTPKQWREDNKEILAKYYKQWREDNKEARAKYNKQWREDNKEAIAKQKKQYYEANKEAIAKQKKQYYEANRGAITHKFMCECGDTSTYQSMARHRKSKKHQQYMMNPFAHM